jgi:hypothetical protein
MDLERSLHNHSLICHYFPLEECIGFYPVETKWIEKS